MIHNKNCIITGGTSGFGSQLSRVFSKKYNLYILSRSEKKFLRLKKEINSKNKVIFLKNDLSDFSKIKKNLLKIKNVDLIIFNAGIIGNSNKHDLPSTYLVNYLSNFLIIKLLTNKILKNKKKVIIINISSKMHKLANLKNISFSKDKFSWIQYANSKLMMLLFMSKLKRKFKKKIAILNFDPGWMKTNFGNNQKGFIRKILNIFRKYFAKNNVFQEIQAKKLFNISQNEYRKFDKKFFDFYGIQKSSSKSKNLFLQKQLWDKSKIFFKLNSRI